MNDESSINMLKLKINASFISLLRCPCCNSEELDLEEFENDHSGSIINGRMICIGCKQWFRIEDRIVDILPIKLRDVHKYERFAQRWNVGFENKSVENDLEAQQKQIEFFKKDSKVYDADVTNSTFYSASDRCCLFEWFTKVKPFNVVLDIGGGTGRQAIPLAELGNDVISLDISEEMLRIAQNKAIEKGVANKIQFILSDANELPFKEQVFNAVICYGVLHHLPSPRNTIKEASRVLKQGGLWYSYDPHDSPLRFIFELAMKVKRLYQEEASDDPLLRTSDLRKWCVEGGLSVDIRYHAFMLPHFINLFNKESAYKILKTLDWCFSKTPIFKWCAGIIITDGIKK
jgi:ubiquinone/menaquinone biosynthesis C-methylase UbiE/uncharacterized protein YbaR (Trm112 family)